MPNQASPSLSTRTNQQKGIQVFDCVNYAWFSKILGQAQDLGGTDQLVRVNKALCFEFRLSLAFYTRYNTWMVILDRLSREQYQIRRRELLILVGVFSGIGLAQTLPCGRSGQQGKKLAARVTMGSSGVSVCLLRIDLCYWTALRTFCVGRTFCIALEKNKLCWVLCRWLFSENVHSFDFQLSGCFDVQCTAH